jgi:uncharacterized membrane protein (DUF485 family)
MHKTGCGRGMTQAQCSRKSGPLKDELIGIRSAMGDASRNLAVAEPKQYRTSKSAWDEIANGRPFQDLMATKKVFIVPAFIFFVVYYFALPVLVGYAPQFMSTKVGFVNLAYLFALSQFFVAWIIAALYVKAANNFDRLAKDILDKAELEMAEDAQGGK